jgi:hypothetical protein
VNDPVLIHGTDERGGTSLRKPDIVVTSSVPRQRVHPDEVNAQLIDFSDKLCLEDPPIAFIWPEVLTNLEFKKNKKIIAFTPPGFYGCSIQETIEPNKFHNPHDPVPTNPILSSKLASSSASAAASTMSSLASASSRKKKNNPEPGKSHVDAH